MSGIQSNILPHVGAVTGSDSGPIVGIESKSKPKRTKKDSKLESISKAPPAPATQAPAPAPAPPSKAELPVAEPTQIHHENITISHSIKIIRDPATNSYTFSYINSQGEAEELYKTYRNDSESESDSDYHSGSDSRSNSDNENESGKGILSSLLTSKKEFVKIEPKDIDIEGCEPLYATKEIKYDILLPFILINRHASSRSNILALLHTTLVSCIEGHCIADGFIKPGSVRIIDFKCGKIVGKNVQFNLDIECLICNPLEQTVISCIAKNITQAGIRALSSDEYSPIVVYITRDYNLNNPNTYYNSIKEGDFIKVRIIGKRFEINDRNIQIIGDIVVPKKEIINNSKKTKQPSITIDGNVEATAAVAVAATTSAVLPAAPSKAPKMPKAPKEPKAPKTPKAPKEPKAPKAPKEPKASKASKAPKEQDGNSQL